MHQLQILFTEFVSHDTKRFILEKPEDYTFTPGQATEVAIDQDEWRDEKRPFTFTSHPDDLVLEFIIKRYPEHNGVTEQLHKLTSGDTLLVDDAWGTIEFEDKGTFIAGGAGITPFICIFRNLAEKDKLKGNKLIFANKEEKDILIKKELDELFGDDVVYILSREEKEEFEHGHVDKDLLDKHDINFEDHFYVCGPPPMEKDIKKMLKENGAQSDSITFEE
jgi:hypothetical protein